VPTLTSSCRLRGALAASLALAPLLAACDQRERAAPVSSAASDSARAPAPAVSIGESLRRFRDGLPVVTALAGGAPSRDALVARFARAVERQDTLAFRAMTLSRAEFAYLYYPSTQYVRPPYELAPDVLWFLAQQNSEKGIGRVVQWHGGRALGLVDYSCPSPSVAQGENRIWNDCVVRYRPPAADSAARRRLFGAIIVRGGQYKFVSYANDF